MPGLCVRCLFAQRTSDYMSSVRYRCSSFSPVHWHSRARDSCCASACAAEFNAGLDSPTHSLLRYRFHYTDAYCTPGYYRLTTHRKRWLMSRVTCSFVQPITGPCLALALGCAASCVEALRFPDKICMLCGVSA